AVVEATAAAMSAGVAAAAAMVGKE
nr:hypothetical protein [Tanacetum cinerariifolium]